MHKRLLTVLAAVVSVFTLLFASASFAQAQDGSPATQQQCGDQVTAQQTNGGDLDCADFSSREEAQAELESGPSDPHNLDADDDGQACETFDYGGTPTNGATSDSETTSAETASDSANREADAFRCELFLRVVRDDRGALRNQYRDEELIVQRFEQCLSADVLKDTIPDKLLPNTGGPPVLLVPWALMLAAAGILLLRRA